MYAVGKVGTFLASSVYTVSGPFHPFGGSVDIIVVEQEDGTFKSSPWYVKFGKFQGVLKRREKKVFVAVNDGDADFHMYLDHKGEAYFLKDAQGEEVVAFSPTEAASSGDEISSHMLALEYPRVEEVANPRPELSEDEKGDDLEFRFEGRDASKQLIQQSVQDRATGGLIGEEINVLPRNHSGVFEIQESPRADDEGLLGDTQPKSLEAGRKEESTNGKVMHVLLNKAIGIEAGVKVTPASAILANALTALQSPLTDDVPLFAEESVKMSTRVRRSSSNNGTIIHGLLNQAIGLQPSHKAGPSSGLLAAAVLHSLRKTVSSDSSSTTPHNHVELVELAEGPNLNPEKNREDASSDSSIGDIKEEVPALDSTANPNAAPSVTSNGNTSDDVTGMQTVSNLGSLSESGTDQPEGEVPIHTGTISPPRNPQFFDLMKTLEVKKLEILDNTLVVEVQEHVENDRLASVGSDCVKDIVEADGRVDSIVVDRQDVIERVRDLQGSLVTGRIPSNLAQAPEWACEENKKYDEASKLVSVHVDKHLVENLQEALTPNIEEGPKSNLEKEKDVSTPSKEIVISGSENARNVRRPEVIPTPGQELLTDSDSVPSATTGDCSKDISTPGKELALPKPPVNLSEVSSPRMKAAIELEMAWREVVEKAATTLKGSPYGTNKKLSHSVSYKKKGLENGESKKPASPGRLPQLHSERKSWGGWLWGGSSAALQSKRTNEQGISTDGKNGELSMDPLDVGNNTGLRAPSGVTSELEDVTKNGTQPMHGVEGSDSNVEAEETVAHSESDSGPTESRKAGADNRGSRGKPEDHQLELGQQKGPGGPPPRRRSWIGLLSRTNTNQSSLSGASSLRSNEDDMQPIFDGLKRETSLERAESVVDLLEESWAKGSPAHRARIRDGRIAHHEHGGAAGGQAAEDSSAVAALERFDDAGNLLASADPDDGLDADGPPHHYYIPETTETKLAVPHLVGTQEENSSIPTPKCNEDTTTNRNVDADDVSGTQQEINITTNESDIETTSIPVDHTSTEDMDVLLMSLDGHLVRAPLGHSDRENPLLADDKSNEVPLLSDDSVRLLKRDGNSPRKLVCFAGVPDEITDTHSIAGNGMQQTQEGAGTQLSDAALDESGGHVHHDASEGKLASSGCEGLKGLAQLLENESLGTGEQKMGSFRRLATESAPDQLGPHSQSAEIPKTNGRDEIDTEIDAADPKEFDDMRAMVFEKLEEDGDGLEDSDERPIERFYSSKDLTEAEEEEENQASKLKRNMSVYMDAVDAVDAVSGDDEQDSAGSGDENDMDDQSRDRSGPIGIPGALDLAQSLPSEKDIQILRSVSESLPDIRRDHLGKSEMLSPRLTLSRSLDSASSPTILSLEPGKQSASSDGVLTARPSNRSPVSNLGKGVVETFVADRTPEKGPEKGEDSEQLQGRMYIPDTQRSTAGSSSSSSSLDDGAKVPETGFELSLCRHLLKEMMGLEAAAQAFTSEKITLEEFKKSGSTIVANDKLVVRVGGRYYPWVVASPIVLGILAFGQVLMAPNEGAIPVEQPIVAFDGQAATNTSSAGGGWKLWPFVRRPRTPERGALASREAMMAVTEAALKGSLTAEYLRMAGYYKRPRKVRTNCPSSQQLASLNLKEGSNKITFTFETRVWGKQQVDARIYLWKWNTRIVISDVDGTITKSDVLGQVMPLMGKDWTQIGVARLFSSIKKNGYELMFLSARAISQAYLTRQFLENIKQDGEVLPDGPMVISPDGLFPSLYREVIRRAPHEFKIACLEDIKSLFPPESKPFYAGFGNRDTDELSYLKVGIPKGKIFIINPKGEVVVNNQVDVKSYTSLHKLVDDMFPAMSFTEQEDYNEWNFWKLPLPDIDDELSVKKGEGSTSSRRSVNKSGRRS